MFVVHHLTSAINADALRAPVILRRQRSNRPEAANRAEETFLNLRDAAKCGESH